MKKLFLVLNPNAGIRQARRILTEMVDLFTRAGYLVTVYPTASRGDAFSFAAAFGAEADLMQYADTTVDAVLEYDRIALGCPAMGAEVLEEEEMQTESDRKKTVVKLVKSLLYDEKDDWYKQYGRERAR